MHQLAILPGFSRLWIFQLLPIIEMSVCARFLYSLLSNRYDDYSHLLRDVMVPLYFVSGELLWLMLHRHSR